jgi:hypothetical protein
MFEDGNEPASWLLLAVASHLFESAIESLREALPWGYAQL